MIRLQDLVKHYRTEEIETTALNHLSLEVREGEFLSIMGPSGCGKSTLLNIIGMIDTPSSGSYYFLSQEIAKASERVRAGLRKSTLGFIFQSFNLIDELTVYENVELPLIYTRMRAAERKQRVEAALEQMNMTHRRNHYPQQLSGGQQQRVAVARAVVHSPKLLLADEPTGNLDTANGDEVMRLLASLNEQGTTIIMVTHSLRCAEYGRRVIHLLDGKIISENHFSPNPA
ncbi:MAG: ABC transporter ATP-binding protein [Bacteroidia bacterium]|nr:ABC transporter ATP-binding protein [Bacteroidia bacterium]